MITLINRLNDLKDKYTNIKRFDESFKTLTLLLTLQEIKKYDLDISLNNEERAFYIFVDENKRRNVLLDYLSKLISLDLKGLETRLDDEKVKLIFDDDLFNDFKNAFLNISSY